MARPKAFDEDEVLDRAVQLFWLKGYEATSIQELVEVMGIQRGSLYAAFGSKQGLFMAVLDRYAEVVVSELLALLNSKPSPKASIHAFFDAIIEHCVKGGPLRGSLVTNAAVEKGLEPGEVHDKILNLLMGLENAFLQTLIKAKDAGEVHCDPKITARFLCSTMQGLLVTGRIRPDPDLLQDIVNKALQHLD